MELETDENSNSRLYRLACEETGGTYSLDDLYTDGPLLSRKSADSAEVNPHIVPVIKSAKNKRYLRRGADKAFHVWKANFLEDRCCENDDLLREFLISSIPHILLNILLILYWITGACIFRLLDETMREKPFEEVVLFTFITTTTIGWGNVYPATYWAKAFSILYLLLGTPLTFVVLGNNGQFIVELYWIIKKGFSRRKDISTCTDLPVHLSVTFLLMHVLIGAFIYSFWADKKEFITSLYFCFISIATIGYGEEVPSTDTRMEYIVTFAYLSVGVILVTMLMGSMSKYLQQIHYIGRTFSGTKNVEVWFGGKVLTVKELVNIVAEQFEISEERLHDVIHDLDSILQHVANEEEDSECCEAAKLYSPFEARQDSGATVKFVDAAPHLLKQHSEIVRRQHSDMVRRSLVMNNRHSETPANSNGLKRKNRVTRAASDSNLHHVLLKENENALHALRVINHTLQKRNSVVRKDSRREKRSPCESPLVSTPGGPPAPTPMQLYMLKVHQSMNSPLVKVNGS